MTLNLTPKPVALQEATKPKREEATKTHRAIAPILLTIYVAEHCPNCRFAYEVAELVRATFPQVQVRLVDLPSATEPIPEVVFATPTYLLNGRVWSLGNPSFQQVTTTLHQLLHI
ncbi:MAG: hypothetical protein U0350_29880 [Caldilineaceae bacterium]